MNAEAFVIESTRYDTSNMHRIPLIRYSVRCVFLFVSFFVEREVFTWKESQMSFW